MDLKSTISLLDRAVNHKNYEELEASAISLKNTIIELQEKITILQEKNADMVTQKAQLDAEIRRLQTQVSNDSAWEQKKGQYEQFERAGSWFYRRKGSNIALCPVCLDADRLEVRIGVDPHLPHLCVCPKCNAHYNKPM